MKPATSNFFVGAAIGSVIVGLLFGGLVKEFYQAKSATQIELKWTRRELEKSSQISKEWRGAYESVLYGRWAPKTNQPAPSEGMIIISRGSINSR